jgi:hypothetical protein
MNEWNEQIESRKKNKESFSYLGDYQWFAVLERKERRAEKKYVIYEYNQ